MKNGSQLKYFFPIHSETLHDDIKDYIHSLDGNKKKCVIANKLANLACAGIPIVPTVFLKQSFFNKDVVLDSELLKLELDEIINFFFNMKKKIYLNQNKPVLLSITSTTLGSVKNFGISDEILPSLICLYGKSVAFNLYIDFLESFSSIILRSEFLDFKKTLGIKTNELSFKEALNQLSCQSFLSKVQEYKSLILKKNGIGFPNQLNDQLLYAFKSFSNLIQDFKKNKIYNALSMDEEVYLQFQVHKELKEQSIEGTVFTRNPYTGNKDLYGNYQKEMSLKKKALKNLKHDEFLLYEKLIQSLPKIEKIFLEIMEVKFYVSEFGDLFFLEFNLAQKNLVSNIVSVTEWNQEGILSDLDAVQKIKPKDLEFILYRSLEKSSQKNITLLNGSGVSASPGAVVGKAFFSLNDAIAFRKKSKNKNQKIILITDDLLISSISDLEMIQGLVIRAGGNASHATVMARSLGIPCIIGYNNLKISQSNRFCHIDGKIIRSGAMVTLESGDTGQLYLGRGKLQNVSFKEERVKKLVQLFKRVINVEKIKLEIRVNINQVEDAKIGMSLGATGIGLFRTENIVMEAQSQKNIQNIFFTNDLNLQEKNLKSLEKKHYQDFKEIFKLMNGKITHIRLMDMPLHHLHFKNKASNKKIKNFSNSKIKVKKDEYLNTFEQKGSRLGLMEPQYYHLQLRAIIRAAYEMIIEKIPIHLGILFPFIFLSKEFEVLKAQFLKIEEEILQELNIHSSNKINFQIGSMIEIPGAALNAGDLAKVGDFFAFGTNDLTQATLGISRDDSAHCLPYYLKNKYLDHDPFKVLANPVKMLISSAIKAGRSVRPEAIYGICGEHGVDDSTLEFCFDEKINYISCSPFQVLSAQLLLIQIYLKSYKRSYSKHLLENFSNDLIITDLDESHNLLISYKDEIDPFLVLKKAG